MTCERNARVVLGYLESEEIVLKRIKEVLESQLMRLQIDEMNLRVAYQALKCKKETETRRKVEVKNELDIQEGALPPKQKINSGAYINEFKTPYEDPISKASQNSEALPELQLEPCHLDQFSDSETDNNEVSDQVMEPPFPDSEVYSLDNLEH